VIRAVIDTNILMRALIKPQGTVGPVLSQLRDGRYRLLYSPLLLAELVDVLSRPRIRHAYGLTEDDIQTALDLLLLRGEPVVPSRTLTVCRDPKDDMLLEAAVAGEAEVIVTGDNDLLVLHPFEGIRIVGPAEFLSLLQL
jgi:putative PIN family toxin of toxin-antitoxin system